MGGYIFISELVIKWEITVQGDPYVQFEHYSTMQHPTTHVTHPSSVLVGLAGMGT